jgi:hypothetical protein
MGSRYWITVVQVGILRCKVEEETKQKILKEILDKQYLGEKEVFIPFWYKKEKAELNKKKDKKK